MLYTNDLLSTALRSLLVPNKTETTTCNDDIPTPEYKIPIESRLVKCLRLWRDDSRAVTTNDRPVHEEIRSLLEWYLCECIRYGQGILRDWWSDGVIHLEITQLTLDSFKLLGVTWIACLGITPFEIDVELYPLDDNCFAKTTFRLGTLDDHGRPILFDRDSSPVSVLEKRPRHHRDWAIAVELTPP
jgi:hypothetical protein